MNQFIVKEKMELLEFLYLNINDLSKKDIKKLLYHSSISVNDKVITKYNYLLKVNDIVRINIYNKDKEIDIIYEDNNIIVVNKKNGILSVSNENNEDITMYNLVSNYIKKKKKNSKIFIIHRLDKETSGVLMFAKSEKIKKIYQDNWDSLVIKREYLAIVNGKIKDSGTIKSYLSEDKNHFVHSAKNGKLAITHFKKYKENDKYSWIEVNIDTGRKNQIRVHMKELGNPIVGDLKYGYKDNKYKRLCLHASKLIIKNPINNEIMEFKATIDKIFT